MASSERIYREACRRSHRILGHYLALWAWRRRVDCVCLDRSQLLSFLCLDAMRNQRLRWLADDIKPLFPYSQPLFLGGVTYGSVFVSRRRFPSDAFDHSMEDEDRVRLLTQAGLKAAQVTRLSSEERMVSVLAAAATGGRTLK